jgi:hypothetical protein
MAHERIGNLVSAPILERLRWIAGVFVLRGVVGNRLREPLAELLFGAVHEAGMAIARAPDQDAKRVELALALHWMLDELFKRPGRKR